jgi:Holliday junction resolvase RusA-like endonuclease
MNILRFEIPGQPKAKKRARNTNNWHNPSDKDMNVIARIIWSQLPKNFKMIPKDVPVTVNIEWFFEPAKKQKTKKFIDLIKNDDYPYVKRIDRDNLDKLILDSCNKLLWYDDAQVYNGKLTKYYSMVPRTEIEVIW